MAKLTLIACPNGAGKTSSAAYFMQQGLLQVLPVNIDGLEDKINTDKIPHDPLRYEIERRKEIDRIFTELCNDAIDSRLDFAYECNLRTDQVKNVKLFEDAGYELHVIYLWLDSIEISEKRVQKRVENGGHFVGKNSILRNYEEGLSNLDFSYRDWNEVYVFDNSVDIETEHNQTFTLLMFAKSGKIEHVSSQFIIKKDLVEKLPRIAKHIISNNM